MDQSTTQPEELTPEQLEKIEVVEKNASEIYTRFQQCMQPTDRISSANNAALTNAAWWAAQLLHLVMTHKQDVNPEKFFADWQKDFIDQVATFHVSILKDEAGASTLQ